MVDFLIEEIDIGGDILARGNQQSPCRFVKTLDKVFVVDSAFHVTNKSGRSVTTGALRNSVTTGALMGLLLQQIRDFRDGGILQQVRDFLGHFCQDNDVTRALQDLTNRVGSAIGVLAVPCVCG